MQVGRDAARDDDQDGRWLTYAQLAEIRQIDKASAIKLATRRGWRRQRDNRGIMTVYVPVEAQNPDRDSARDGYRDVSLAIDRDNRDMAEELSRIADGFQDAVERISEAKDSEISTLRGELERANTRISGLEAGSATLQADLKASQEAVQRAEAALDRYYAAEAERRGRGRLARLRAAWRGK